ncbi:MAG TPA: DUF4595 domain-containing protein [Bacteroides reticulotermitis]|nr:DUF4595 domain-containing protein [Bacteroides reticulotermitis]
MKKSLLLILFTAFIMTSCSNDDNDASDTQIKLSNQSEQNQQAYADDETTDGFTFTAKDEWTATISGKSVTRTSSSTWLRLLNKGVETYSGSAGTVTLNVELDPNYSGQKRSATVTISCAKEKIAITVTQDKATADGKTNKLISRLIFHDHDANGDHRLYDVTWAFSYDTKGRVQSIVKTSSSNTYTYEYTYKGNEVICTESDPNHNVQTYTHPLNALGYIASSTEAYGDSYTFTYNNNGYLTDVSGNRISWLEGNFTQIDYKDEAVVEHFTYYLQYANNQNLDLALLLAELPFFFGRELGFSGFTGKRTTNLIHKSEEQYEGEESISVYRYDFDEDRYVKEIYCKWNNDPEANWYSIEY